MEIHNKFLWYGGDLHFEKSQIKTTKKELEKADSAIEKFIVELTMNSPGQSNP